MSPSSKRIHRSLLAACAALALHSSVALADPTFLGPLPYLSADDSPFKAEIDSGSGYLEDFECGHLVAPGVTADPTALVYGPNFDADSVDGDDGTIDGSGANGHSFLRLDAAVITFTFDADVLGQLPTKAGVVWTDGGTDCDVTFEAFGPGGVSLGTIFAAGVGDDSNSGTTAEDRFFGVIDSGGIESIRISHNTGGLEVDHLQYVVDDLVFRDAFECSTRYWSNVVP